MKNVQKGFSFIEILVVVTIIGIISAVGMVTYTEFIKQSRDAKRKGDLEQIRGSLEIYKSKNNTYPLTAEVVFGSDLCDPLPGGCGAGTYLKKIANDPKTGTYIYYYLSATGSDYTLGAHLEQGSTSNCGTNCGGGVQVCNYCLGPYGQL